MADGSKSKKHDDFVRVPMRDKGVSEIPGIGKKSAEHLRKKNWIKANQVYGQFLVDKQDKGKFKEFIKKFGCNEGQQNAAYNAIKEYSDQYT